MFKKAMLYYKMGIYSKQMLQMLVMKGVLSADQYKKITGEAFNA